MPIMTRGLPKKRTQKVSLFFCERRLLEANNTNALLYSVVTRKTSIWEAVIGFHRIFPSRLLQKLRQIHFPETLKGIKIDSPTFYALEAWGGIVKHVICNLGRTVGKVEHWTTLADIVVSLRTRQERTARVNQQTFSSSVCYKSTICTHVGEMTVNTFHALNHKIPFFKGFPLGHGWTMTVFWDVVIRCCLSNNKTTKRMPSHNSVPLFGIVLYTVTLSHWSHRRRPLGYCLEKEILVRLGQWSWGLEVCDIHALKSFLLYGDCFTSAEGSGSMERGQ